MQGMRVGARRGWILMLVVFACSIHARASAQSVIAGVPNTDVTKPGTLMLAQETQLNTWSYPKPYVNSFTFATVGVGSNIELAATLFGLSSPGSGNVALGLGYKHRIPLLQRAKWEPTLAIGQMMPISFSGTGLGFWTFGVSSVRIPATDTRFTLGISYGSRQIFGRTVPSLIAGIEQPVSKKFSLIADWFSGYHDLAALITAVQWNPTKELIVIAGAKIPNTPVAGPVALTVEITYDFELFDLEKKHTKAEETERPLRTAPEPRAVEQAATYP
jgi:hypothetical protein